MASCTDAFPCFRPCAPLFCGSQGSVAFAPAPGLRHFTPHRALSLRQEVGCSPPRRPLQHASGSAGHGGRMLSKRLGLAHALSCRAASEETQCPSSLGSHCLLSVTSYQALVFCLGGAHLPFNPTPEPGHPGSGGAVPRFAPFPRQPRPPTSGLRWDFAGRWLVSPAPASAGPLRSAQLPSSLTIFFFKIQPVITIAPLAPNAVSGTWWALKYVLRDKIFRLCLNLGPFSENSNVQGCVGLKAWQGRLSGGDQRDSGEVMVVTPPLSEQG